MEKKQYNLIALLRFDDLEIRNLAMKNPSLWVDAYFDLLSNFVRNVPLAIETLSNISSGNASSIDYKNIAHIRTLLENIGCKKLASVMKDIVKAGKSGNHELAAEHTHNLEEKIQELHKRIMAAEKVEYVSDDPDADEESKFDEEMQPISMFLMLLDEEEAKRKLKILAVDDAPVMIHTITSLLSDEYKVYGMTNPNLLEKFLHKITPELFLLDYNMPELSGFDLVPIIRSFEEHKNTPIIFLTSSGTTDHVAAALALGAVDFMVKPFQIEILREKIARHIVRKKIN
jgi:CheY-like chemotaxis protein